MPEGGKLTIEMANAALDDAYAARHVEVEPGQYVLLAITDTGKGMDEATLGRPLDPFFMTKRLVKALSLIRRRSMACKAAGRASENLQRGRRRNHRQGLPSPQL
jgi:hypothetical protein